AAMRLEPEAGLWPPFVLRDARYERPAFWKGLCRRAPQDEGGREALLRRALKELHQCRAVRRRADTLLRHFGAGGVNHRADLKQFRHCLRGPYNLELLERLGEIIAGKRRDPAPEQSGKRRSCAHAFIGVECVACDAGSENFGTMIAGETCQRI